MPLTPTRPLAALALAALAACAGAPAPATAPVPVPAPSAPSARPLPPVPEVDGPLAIKVVYPAANQSIPPVDSNFIFGSVGSGRATLSINGVPVRVAPNGAFLGYLPLPRGASPRYELVAARGSDSARASLPIRVAVAAEQPPAPQAERRAEAQPAVRADSLAALHARVDSLASAVARAEPQGWVQLGEPSAAADSDRTIIGRPVPGGTYKWFFLPGTVVPAFAGNGRAVRVQLSAGLDAWVDSADTRPLPAGARVPNRVTSNIRVRGSAHGEQVVIPMGARPPYLVEEGERSIVLTLYGVRANTDAVNYAAADSMVRTVEWVQETADRVRLTVNLRAAPYGYLVLWQDNSLVLELRGRPAIDPARPLAGLVIAVDPGHPPIGATGPTGLWEPQATLPIGDRLRRILEERGARVVMTRTNANPVALGDRPVIARRANANAFVSIHLNAYGDGVNPFRAPGTGTYFFRTHSEPLARAVQRGMVSEMGLMDLGVNYENFAVVRGTWYPAVLCEGAFLMIPEQEAALRTPEFQERYAKGVADGLESFFRTLTTR